MGDRRSPTFGLTRPAAALAALALVLALAVPSVTALTPVTATQVPLGTYAASPTMTQISGWYWMRTGYAENGTWTFPAFDPTALHTGRNLYFVIQPLVTNGTNGGAGWDARVKVDVTYAWSGGSKVLHYRVTLRNPFPFRSTASSGGVGYQTYGEVHVGKGVFNHGVGTLTVTIARDATFVRDGYHPHVALNATALSVWYPHP